MSLDSKTSTNQVNKKLDFLYEDAPNPYQSLDSNGIILKVNQKWLDLLDYKKEEVIGRWFGDMITEHSRMLFNTNFTKFKALGSIQDVEFDMIHKNDSIIPILLYGQITYDNSHTVLETHCSFEDMSDKRRIEHLNGVLSVIRDVNQLIVREKDRQKMLQESCHILASKHIYGYAWIILFDAQQRVEHITISEHSQEFKLFKEKILGGWKPYCIYKKDKIFSTIQNTQETCSDCPMKDSYDANQAGLNIELKHLDKSYGYLNISVDKKYIEDDEELSLLKEVAGDIAYALYNIHREKLLVQREERYRFAIEGGTDGLWDWNLLDDTIYFSPKWKEILGYKNDELKNDLKTWMGLLHPNDREKLLLDVEQAREGHIEKYHNTIRLQHKDGHWVWVETRGQIIYDKNCNALRMVGSHADISEQKKAQESLVSLKELYANIINSVENMIFVKDKELKYITCNRAFEKYVNISKEDIAGKSDFDLVDEKTAQFFQDYDTKVLLQKKAISNTEWVKYPDGKRVCLLTVKSPLFDSNGVFIGLVGNSTDITEQKNKDEMLINQSRHAAMGEMIGMIAHQWRQPLSTISMDANNMLLDIAIDNFSSDEAEKYANSISAQTQHLSQTIDDFRNFFKPDKEIVRVNIRDILEQTLSIVQDSLQNNNIKFTSSFETQTEVDAYPRELMQVFVNIITNAKDVLSSIKKENAFITLRVYEDEKYLITEICDNGGGIADDILPKVFDPYFSTKDEKTGTGLGLYMSKMIIEEHLDGLIEAYNGSEGACFSVKLLKMEA